MLTHTHTRLLYKLSIVSFHSGTYQHPGWATDSSVVVKALMTHLFFNSEKAMVMVHGISRSHSGDPLTAQEPDAAAQLLQMVSVNLGRGPAQVRTRASFCQSSQTPRNAATAGKCFNLSARMGRAQFFGSGITGLLMAC